MDFKSSNYLSIGAFARLSGIRRANLIYYDEIGLFSPEIKGENGYRYYSYNQLDAVNIIHSLKEIGVPLKEIKTYLDTRTPEKMIALFSAQKRQIDREIEKLQSISSMLQSRIILTQQGQQVDPARILLTDCAAEELLCSEPIEDLEEAILSFYDYCTTHRINCGYPVGAILPKEKFTAGFFDQWSHYFMKLSKDDHRTDTMVKPAGLYVVGYLRGDYRQTEELYRRLLRYIEENGLEVCGDAYEESLLDEIAMQKLDQYVTQISIQVTRKK